MLKRVFVAAGLGCALSVLAFTGEAKADGATWGNATLNGGPRFASEDLDFGLGLNVGYTLGMGLYLGGLANHYFAGRGFDVSFVHFDIGYDIGFGNKFVLRPSGSVGPGIGWCDACRDEMQTEFSFTAGANAIYAISELTIGGELRYWWIDDFRDADGIWAGFNIGVIF
jgi:hypothetical protein